MRYVASTGDQQHTVDLQENGHTLQITLDGRQLTLDWRLIGRELSQLTRPGDARADHYSLLVGRHSYDAYVRLVESDDGSEGLAVEVMIAGRPYLVRVQDERSRTLASLAGGAHASGDVAVKAPMPGLVTHVLVAPGDEVKRGQTVVVLEAMKMENDLSTPRAGIVKSLHVHKGQAVNQGEALVVIGEPAGAPLDPADED
jgi:biotin carboxyl carrier protein